MAIATCPKCATKLKVPDGTTASVRCPKCQTVFKTSAPAAAAPPPPPPPAPAAKQASPFENLDDDDDRPRSKKRPRDDDDDDDRPRKKRREDDDEDDRPRSKKRDRDEDDEDDRPRKKRRDDDDEDDRPRSKKRDRGDEDDDDRPRKKRPRDDDDDDDDRPRSKKRSRDDDEDDYDDRPKKSGSKFGLARTGVLLLLISLGLCLAALSLQALFILIAFIGGVIPGALGLITGLMGLGSWITGLIGLGFCIAGPSRSRGLAIAAVSVSAVHLILCFVTANDSESGPSLISVHMLSGMNRAANITSVAKDLMKEEQKNPGSARAKELREDLKAMGEDAKEEVGALTGRDRGSKMRWSDLTTYLVYSDRLVAEIAYDSKNFSKTLLGTFTGLSELARIILMSLMLASMAGVLKDYRAESKAKLGWIVGASAGGAGLLIMLLTAVIVDNSKPDSKDQPKMPTPPNTMNMSPQQAQKAFEDHQKAVQAEMDKFQEKMESAVKAPARWLGVGELLCLLAHIASIALPGLAALAIWSGTGGGGGGARYKPKKRSRRDDDDDD